MNNNPIKILIVEDESDLKFLLTRKFRRRIQGGELEFIFANNGLEALDQLQAHPNVAVVLSDINMPQMDGLTLLTHLNERYPHLRSIIISAYGDMQNIRTAMNRGAYDFLTKPIDFDDLEMTLNRAIRYEQQVMQDLTERQQTEKRLLQLEKAVENMQLGVTITDLDGKILYTNPAEARIHGYQVGELIGQDVGIFAPPTFRKAVTLEEIKQWKGLIRESVNIRKDGRSFPVWLMSEIVKGPDGKPTAIVTSCEDITERKQAEEELKQHRDHLEELVQERTVELTTANQQLQQEIIERKRVEAELRTTYQNLKALNDRLQGEFTLAQKIQQSLLPFPTPDWPGLDVVCYSTPAREVGGDFYAYHAFQRPEGSQRSVAHSVEGRYAIAVGDVSGKGMPAALLMAVSLASFQEVIGRGLLPGELLAYLDQTIAPYKKTTLQNCALVYVEVTTPTRDQTGIVRIVNAGCITPLIRRVNGPVEWVDVSGMPLGTGWGTKLGYQEVTLEVNRGDLIILTSDGVAEARSPADEMFGFERLEQTVKLGPQTSAGAMLAHLQSTVMTFMGNAELHDDVTMVVVRV